MGGSAQPIGTVVIRNNIFYNSLNMEDPSSITSLAMDYNDYYNQYLPFSFSGGLTLAQFRTAFPGQEQNSISLAPLLDTGGLYTQLSGSPTIDHGMALPAVNGVSFDTDFNGASRPSGSGWDIGAFEFGGTISGAPAAPTGLHVVP